MRVAFVFSSIYTPKCDRRAVYIAIHVGTDAGREERESFDCSMSV